MIRNKKTYFIITVDTETYRINGKAPELDRHIYGVIGNEEYGVSKIMETCDTHNSKATFFVDFCMIHQYGESSITDLCRHIDNQGHDIQVHAHPNWIHGYNKTTLHSYSFDDQKKIILESKQMYEKFLNRSPLAFRAGAYGANKDTIRVLDNSGFKVDSSYFQMNQNCVLSRELSHRYINKMFYLGNILELPITLYSMLGGVYNRRSKIDINACSWSEIKHVLSDYIRQSRILFVILFLHSFSFIKQGNKVGEIFPNNRVFRKFEKTLQFLKKDPGVEIITLTDFFKKTGEFNYNFSNNDYVGVASPWLMIPRLLGRAFGL